MSHASHGKYDTGHHSLSLGTDPPPANQNPAISSVPQSLKILTSPPRQTKSPDNSNTLNMFNNNTYTNFKRTYKHMLLLQWCHTLELFGSQIPVTTGGFELGISCIWSN